MRMFMTFTASTHNENLQRYLARQEQLDKYYESNYQIADFYEAWAIWCFSTLCVATVRNVGLKRHWNGDARALFKPLASITLLGVQSFVIVYGLSSAYSMVLNLISNLVMGEDVCSLSADYDKFRTVNEIDFADTLNPFAAASAKEFKNGQYKLIEGFLPIMNSVCSLQQYISGASFTVSCLALYNIIAFEIDLHDFLHDFQPTWKFWGAKILVSIAFIQTFVLQTLLVDTFKILSEPQQKLFYSALITWECLPIALLHLYAWKHDAEWYSSPEWSLCKKEGSGDKWEIWTDTSSGNGDGSVKNRKISDAKNEQPVLVTVPASGTA